MASANTTASDSVESSAADHGKESLDPFTLQGYMKMIDDEKVGPAILRDLMSSYSNHKLEAWKKKLIEPQNFESVKSLFALSHIDVKERSNWVNLIEIFVLLENVFRNVILRPYIPAYRSINMDCGRYHSFVTPLKDSVPFKTLNFRENPPNLLTYCGTNQLETMMCAHTCAYLQHILKRVLDDYEKKSGQSQSKTSAH